MSGACETGHELRGYCNNLGERCTVLIARGVVRHVRFRIYFEVKPTEFAGGLEVGTQAKRGVRGDTRILH